MATYESDHSATGFEIIRLQNPCMSVSVMPQLGGKIYELIDLRTGRDWLWKNAHIALRKPEPGLSYEKELDSGGWDEILFSVKPDTIDLANGEQLKIGDHGSVVDRAWHRAETGLNDSNEAVCEVFAKGSSPRFSFHRRMVLDDTLPRLSIEYRLHNTGQTAWPWLWCAHPLLAIEEGMLIKLQSGQPLRSEIASLSAGDQKWPTLVSTSGNRYDLEKIFDSSIYPENFCAKLFVRSGNEVSIRTTDGAERFSMMYDTETLPWLGLWVNKNAWSGCGSEPYLNLGLEPTTSPHDKLTDAIAHNESCFLAPGGVKKWSLTISLDQAEQPC